ncbi:MAG: SDR family NAD(P)-dependent oxidoreductase [Sandaracinaceae bacterium]
MPELEGKVALVTGASRGIGAAIASRLAGDGARVVVHFHRDEDAARGVLRSIGGEASGHALVRADLSDPDATRRMVDAAVEHGGRLDVLVNNAGIYELAHVLEDDWDAWRATWDRTMQLNLLGPAHAIYWAARRMGEGGRIVNVGSRGAYRGEPTAPAYGAAKAGLHQLTQSLAVALAPRGISLIAIAPGYVETEMARPHLEGPGGAAIRAESPFGRVASPDEVAYWVLAACRPDAGFASGAVIDVNGASYLRS